MIEHNGQAAGCLIGYAVAEAPAPIPDDFTAMFRPLQELENLAPGTWYVDVQAVLPAFRHLGLGSGLLQRAETTARDGSQIGSETGGENVCQYVESTVSDLTLKKQT